jgi:hypothetical protein
MSSFSKKKFRVLYFIPPSQLHLSSSNAALSSFTQGFPILISFSFSPTPSHHLKALPKVIILPILHTQSVPNPIFSINHPLRQRTTNAKEDKKRPPSPEWIN